MINQVTTHALSRDELSSLFKVFSGLSGESFVVRVSKSLTIPETPTGVSLVDLRPAYRDAMRGMGGEDEFTELLAVKRILPIDLGLCILKVGGTNPDLSLLFSVVGKVVRGDAFQSLLVLSSMSSVLQDMLAKSAGPDEADFENVLREGRILIRAQFDPNDAEAMLLGRST